MTIMTLFSRVAHQCVSMLRYLTLASPSQTGCKPRTISCFKGKRMQRGGVPTQIANFDYRPSRSGSGHIDRPLLVGRLRASVDMWTRRRAEQPWAMAWIRSVSMPLLLQTALGFWGMRYVHFPQALPHTCEIWGCQSSTVRDFRLVGYDAAKNGI